MTDEEKALRDAFLAELWPTCREWHSTAVERESAKERNALLTSVDNGGETVDEGRHCA